jgi:hypothetical protein
MAALMNSVQAFIDDIKSSLPADQRDHSGWIWNEGCPAEIVPIEETRIVLLGTLPPMSAVGVRAANSLQ